MFRRRLVAVGWIPGPLAAVAVAGFAVSPLAAQEPGQQETADPVAELVERLTLDNYKATLKGLTQFGDRRQGTQRNRDAVDWIEGQLEGFGCTNTERIFYMFPPPDAAPRRAPARGPVRPRPPPRAQDDDLTTATGGRGRTSGIRFRRQRDLRPPRPHGRQPRPDGATRRAHPGAQPGRAGRRRPFPGLLHQGRHDAPRRDVHRGRTHGRARRERGRGR